MDIHQFFQTKEATLVPVFKTNKPLKLTTYVWGIGDDPYKDPLVIEVPVGTELLVNSYSNFGDGYSMSLCNPNASFGKSSKKRAMRWMRVNYEDMDYSHHKLQCNMPKQDIIIK